MERRACASLTGERTWGEGCMRTIREEEGVMSLSNGPAETSGQPLRPAAGAAPSPFAPRWARDGWSQRKVVPLHLPAAPQLVPASPGETDAAPRIPCPAVRWCRTHGG